MLRQVAGVRCGPVLALLKEAMTSSHGPAIADLQTQIAALREQIRTHEAALAELREKESELQTIVSTLEEMDKFMRESGKSVRRRDGRSTDLPKVSKNFFGGNASG